MYVHGGSTLNDQSSADTLWQLDLRSLAWHKLPQKDNVGLPKGLYGHTITWFMGDLYLFGGTTGFDYFRHFVKYSLVSKEW